MKSKLGFFFSLEVVVMMRDRESENCFKVLDFGGTNSTFG